MVPFLVQSSCKYLRTTSLIPKLRLYNQTLSRWPNRPLTTYVDPITRGLSDGAKKYVGYWLMGMAGMTFGAIILGGVTR